MSSINRTVKEKSGKGGVTTPTNPSGSLPVANEPVLGQKVTSVKKKSKSGSSKVVPRQSSSTEDDTHLSDGEIVEDPDRLGSETAGELFESSDDGSDKQTSAPRPRSAPQSEPSTDEEPRQARIRKRSPREDELDTVETPAPKVKKVRAVQAAPVTQAISVNQSYVTLYRILSPGIVDQFLHQARRPGFANSITHLSQLIYDDAQYLITGRLLARKDIWSTCCPDIPAIEMRNWVNKCTVLEAANLVHTLFGPDSQALATQSASIEALLREVEFGWDTKNEDVEDSVFLNIHKLVKLHSGPQPFSPRETL